MHSPLRILQIVPALETGRGVEAVAFHLEQEWRRLGIETARFTLEDARGGWLPEPGPGLRGKVVLAARVVWFTTIGTALARRTVSGQPAGTVVICHNDALVGDVYVNHGILAEAMRARGHFAGRMLRNPMHLFTWLRDAYRYGSGLHSRVINLTQDEDRILRRAYPRVSSRTTVIGNGVEIDRYRPDAAGRASARARLNIGDDDVVALFVGHEFGRKGLPIVLEAMRGGPKRLHLVVVGGTSDMIAEAGRQADSLGLSRTVHFVGQQRDPRPYFHLSDVMVFPSAYESYGLVVLEALACGLPVVATPVGCVPDVITDGIDGFVVDAEPEALREGLARALSADLPSMGDAARRKAETHAWSKIAGEYLQMFAEVLKEKQR